MAKRSRLLSDTLQWTEVKQKMLKRFGQVLVHPLLKAKNRYLRANESVTDFYNEMITLLRQAKLDDQATVAYLTAGMPSSYRTHLISPIITSPSVWLESAVHLEHHLRRPTLPSQPKPSFQQKFPNQQKNRAFVNIAEGTEGRNEQKNRRPPVCRYCQRAGETAYHWHRDCTRRQSQQQSSSTDSRPQMEEVAAPAEVLNFQGDRS